MSAAAESPRVKATSVARFGGIMVFGLLLSRILGMIRDTVMVYQFGIGLNTDSYRLAVQIPDLIFMLIAGGGLSSAFIPVFSDLIHKNREKEAWKAFSVVVTTCATIAVALVAIAWALAPALVSYLAAGKDPRVIPEAVVMSRIMLPAQIAFLVGSILLATQYSRKQFLAPALAPNVYNVGIILGALLLPRLMGMGVESMAWGALIGAVIGNIVLPVFSMGRESRVFRPSFSVKAAGVDTFFKLLLPVILGFSLPSMVNLITQKFASEYGTNGTNTVLALSNNLMQAPLGIFGQSLALAAFPVLAEYVAIKRMDLYRSQVSKTLRTVLYLGVPSGAFMLALAPQIVHVLYGYGKGTQNPGELAATADCLRIYSLGIFAWCMQPVLMRGFFSLHKTLKPIAIGTAMTGAFILLCVLSIHLSPDFRWIPAVTDVAATVLAVLLFFALERDVGRLDRKGVASTLALSTVAAVVSAGAVFAVMHLFHPGRKLVEFADIIFGGLIGAWIYYFLTRWMKMPETEYLDRALAKVNRRKPRPKPA